jgi:hypothetical protein
VTPGQFLPPAHDRGDANTIGGYMAVHDRPAAFEGSDGFSYSVEILTEPVDDEQAAFFLFVRWARIGAQVPEGHLESDYVARGATGTEARSMAGALSLASVRALLEELITARAGGTPRRRWWDAMRDEGDAPGGESV